MPNQRAHRDQNRVETLLAAASDGSGLTVELVADPATSRLLVSSTGGGGGGGTEYTDGDVAPAHPVGGIPVFNSGGTITAVSTANPLPISIISGAGSGGTAMADDAAFTVGTTSFTPAGGTYRSVRDAVDDNDGGAFAMTPKRAQYVSLETPNADSVMDEALDTVKISQATAANLNATVVGTGTFAVQASVSTTDIAPATQSVTVIDSGSSSAAGANNQTIVIGTPTAGSAASFALSSIETIRVEVTGIWTGTLTAEQSVDGGTTWTSQGLHQGAYTTSSFTAGFIGGANVAGSTNFRMRATAAMTGTAVVKVVESLNTQSVYIANAAPAGNVISTLNSSTATLTAASAFTGTGEDVSNFSEMRVSVWASHASATDGLSIQQSSNGTNWDITDTYTIAATTGKTFVVPRQARFIRVVYTNGGTNQSSFRLQTILNRTATASSSQRAQDGYSNENDLEQVWSFGSFYNGTTWDMARGDTANGMDVDVTRLPALAAGSAVVGKVGIDQTTPGTTNLVSLSAETTKVIGTVNQGTSPWVTSNATTSVVGNGTAAAAQRVTLANDSTGVIATVGAVTAITNALPTGTNSLGKISDITTSMVPGTAAANLGKAEDAAHASGDTGVFALGVRNDGAATAFSGTNGDYTPVATDAQGRVYVIQKAPTATLSNVASSATSVTVLAANTARLGGQIYNDSTQILYLKFGSTASATSFTVPLAAATYYEIPAGYTGIIDGIWVSANGNARVTEES